MATHRNTTLLLRGALALACAPALLMLSGCPSDTAGKTAAPGSIPGYATAPALTPGQQQSAAQLKAQQQQNAQAAAAAAHSKKVQDTIDRSEANYRSGVANYNANHLDAARLDFDAAVDGMLSSGLDLKNDPELADEFDRLLSAINSLELLALRQGNGFSPKLEETPVDAAGEVTFAADPLLLNKVTAELKTTTSDMPLVVNEYVAGWIDAFTNRPALHAHLKRSLERAGKYKALITRILAEQGVPQDLIYQAVTESGFQPQALNAKSGAAGMWQFMRSNDYLKSNGYFDERFDPEKSTIAYAKYMKFLYGQTGDWYLAMAAYDWGLGRVQHVVSRTGYADYWDLYRHSNLPAETKAYIPSVIAAIIMAKNPAQYGLGDLVPDAPVLSDTVTVDYSISLSLVADLTQATVPEIVALNPALLRLSTPRDLSYDLHVPVGTRAAFLDRLKDIPEENRASWRFHVVKDGETLEQVATNFHAHATEIAEYNDVTAAQPIEAGDELIVPVAGVSASASGQSRYTVGRSDTLITVADRFGVTVEQLRSWNHLAANRVTPGRTLYVTEPIRLAPGGRSSRARARSTSKNRSTKSSSHSSRESSRAPSKSSASHGRASAASAPRNSTKNAKHRAR